MNIIAPTHKTAIEATSAEPKKVFIKTYGCQMNVYDSERMGDALGVAGYVATENAEDADLVLLNTCHIREKAAEKVYSDIGRYRVIREKRLAAGHKTTIGVAGCVAQAEGEEIIRRAPAVDLVLGPQTYHRIADMVTRAQTGKKVVETDYAIEDKFAHLPKADKKAIKARGVSAFLTVQEGCDKFCTFCVVPYTRGTEVSRPVSQLIAEATRLVETGVREITLLGQNVNAWHGEGPDGTQWNLAQLLELLSGIDGLARLRYTTSHPRDMDEALINAHRDLETLMPYLHLPVQSGSDTILKAMNRKHTAKEYCDLIDRIRAVRPDIAMSGDFIVGFPGETDQDFEDTMELIRKVRYTSAYSFKYSPRPGTPAAPLENQVPEQIKNERLQRLQALITQQQREFAASCVGQDMDVLIEKQGRIETQLVGRSPWLMPVVLPVNAGQIGDIVNVRITGLGTNCLIAEGTSLADN